MGDVKNILSEIRFIFTIINKFLDIIKESFMTEQEPLANSDVRESASGRS